MSARAPRRRAAQRATRSFASGPTCSPALPIAAEDGTLAHRAEGARGLVRAKTGSLDGVTALAGYARTERGRELVFAVIVERRTGAATSAAIDGAPTRSRATGPR